MEISGQIRSPTALTKEKEPMISTARKWILVVYSVASHITYYALSSMFETWHKQSSPILLQDRVAHTC
jgi:hypothetical protein